MKNRILSIITLMSIVFTSFALTPKEVKFEQPVLITSAGQSADVKLVKLLASKTAIKGKTILMAKASDLAGAKTLIIVPGFSSKGLGAAGISQEDETNRVIALINKANELQIPIVLMHIGGKARREGQSDGFCKLVADNCKYMIVVKQGNEDGFFTEIATSKNIPLKIADKISSTMKPMKEIF